MDINSIVSIGILVFCVIMSAYFSATETAFTSLNRLRLKSKAEGGNRRAVKTLALAEKYDNLLSTILIGNNIVNISAAAIATVLFTNSFGSQLGPTLATIVLTLIILVFGEISPKSLAKERPESFAMVVTPSLKVFIFLFAPINFIFALWKKLLSKMFHHSDSEGITEEELITMVSEAESEGGLDFHESKLIRSAIEFNDLEVESILTPRVEMVAIEDIDTMDEIAAVFTESGYSRLPVYHDTVDDVIGILHEKDFHIARYKGETDISHAITKPLYTTATTKISQLLRLLQQSKIHIVIVVDEYGGVAGLCTMEDIVEELVGEIWDEHDEIIEEFKIQEDGSYLVDSTADLTDLYDLFSIKGDCDANTVSGWVLEELGRVPIAGDHFVLEGLDVTVTKVNHRRVLEIQVIALDQSQIKDQDKNQTQEQENIK